ncbi:PLP-dependent transferase [Atractiella rhizophila]|nr:PLP-dependent transferase [Atractiella rhizophila]
MLERPTEESEAHRIFRSYPGTTPKKEYHHHHKARKHGIPTPSSAVGVLKSAISPDGGLGNEEKQKEAEKEMEQDNHSEPLPGIQNPGGMAGVIFVMDRAFANGFTYTSDEWANFGQGAPEVGEIPGAPPRPRSISLDSTPDINEYAPTTGVKELRQAVADYYNYSFREGKESKYTYENVCIVPGGRAGLTRVAAVVGDVLVSYSLPEYTAYDQMLSVFKRMVPIPTSLDATDNYRLNVDKLRENIHKMGLSVVVVSNPKNPTGQAIEGEELERLVSLSRTDQTTLVLDEFYSAYNYEGKEGDALSASRYIEDVNKDPVILIDGLTKGFRLPGWRCCWVVAPRNIISALSQSGSFLDGGASHPIQIAAIPFLKKEFVMQDRLALQRHFKMKRDHVLKRLKDMGLEVKVPPKWTFYIWLDLSDLPEPLSSGLVFFEELLKEKCIVVPGLFFDINPSHRRNLSDSPCHHFVRLSFGPPLEQLDKGLDSIERVLKKARAHMEEKGHLNEFGQNLKFSGPSHFSNSSTHGRPGWS